MTHASLFSGIGGFDLAAEWAGWENLFNCEIDPFCKRVLKFHFPDAIQYSDIRDTDFTIWRGRIDVLSGGFPCQPFSQAGKRLGTEDERHLWPEMLRAIREIRPRWVVGENVRGIITWSDGLVFEQVCADLEAEGYEVQPYLLPAAGVGAPHERYRTWFVAHRANAGVEGLRKWEDGVLSSRFTPNSHCTGLQTTGAEQQSAGFEQYGKLAASYAGSEQLKNRAQDYIPTHREEIGAGVDGGVERSGNIKDATDAYGELQERRDKQGSKNKGGV